MGSVVKMVDVIRAGVPDEVELPPELLVEVAEPVLVLEGADEDTDNGIKPIMGGSLPSIP